MSDEPKEFSRAIENLIAGFRDLPENESRSKSRKITELSTVIEELLVKYRINHDSLEHSIRAAWPQLVGVANASYSHPVVVERNLLIVLTSHAVVRNELFQHRTPILAKLQKLPGCAHIKGLHFRAG